jgi:threonylcarbamoyladenosine tRNA methylthiotransferase CDKAL1
VLSLQFTRRFAEGVRELWLTSEDLGAYGRDLGVTLPELLNALVDVIPAGCMMRLGMTNPPYILDYLPVRPNLPLKSFMHIFVQEIAAILNHERVFAFLHIPVQSGSDAVLKDMKREYTSKHFRTVVDFMREK